MHSKNKSITHLKKCKICNNTNLERVLQLNEQYISATFVKSNLNNDLTKIKTPLTLVLCAKKENEKNCGLLQLLEITEPDLLYREYFYRSSTSNTMKIDLEDVVNSIKDIVNLNSGDVIVDTGSNDCTLLNFYEKNLTLVGFEPARNINYIDKGKNIKIFQNYFNSNEYKQIFKNKAKVITSCAMFYDLAEPKEFVKNIVEILNDDGSMARVHDLKKVSLKHNICLVSIKDLISYRLKNESLIKKEIEINLPTDFGDFKLVAFTQINTEDVHLALIKGKWKKNDSVLVRVHSSCVTGDIFHSLKCDCGDQLNESMKIINKEGKGVVLYMNQEGRGIGFINKLKAYKLQENGLDTVQANKKLGFKPDQRDYGIGAQILRYLNISKIKLLTNNPKKRIGLIGYGLEIIQNIPIECTPNEHNINYLKTKRDKMGHKILIDKK